MGLFHSVCPQKIQQPNLIGNIVIDQRLTLATGHAPCLADLKCTALDLVQAAFRDPSIGATNSLKHMLGPVRAFAAEVHARLQDSHDQASTPLLTASHA
jgi:hypothetical protein